MKSKLQLHALTHATYWPFLRMFASFVVWLAVFVVLYGVHALACLYVHPDSAMAGATRAVLIALWLAPVAALAYLAWRGWSTRPSYPQKEALQQNGQFLRRVTCLLDVFACIATFATGLPLVWMKVCAA